MEIRSGKDSTDSSLHLKRLYVACEIVTLRMQSISKEAMQLLLLSRFSCVRLCDPMDCSLPGFSVHGILQARTLEWVAISFSNA